MPPTTALELLLPILFGALVGGAIALYSFRRGLASFRRVWALGLMAAAAIYVGFAARWGDSAALGLETVGVAVFAVVGWLGLRRPSVIAVGWMAHVAWDLAFHPPGAGSWAPAWYPLACVGFDLVVAGFVAGATRPPTSAWSTSVP